MYHGEDYATCEVSQWVNRNGSLDRGLETQHARVGQEEDTLEEMRTYPFRVQNLR